MDIYPLKTWDSRSKSDDTPVTKADLAADKIISTGLLKAYPDIPIISEESEHLPYEKRRDFGYCWIVDPLDGTKEFIGRTGNFVVMIGLCLNGFPVLGVVHAPAEDVPKTYYAVSGKGAFVTESGSGMVDSKRISATSFAWQEPGVRLAISSSRPPEAFIAACNKPKTFSIGSSGLKAIAVAEGRADVFPCYSNTSEWDTCATHIIVEEAGGAVFRVDEMEERGLAMLAELQHPADAAQGESRGEEKSNRGSGDGFRVRYNKQDLGSPRCIFVGRWCS